MKEYRIQVHSFEPVYDENSRILILGTMPSPRSREDGFYYSHPRNRFWAVMAGVFGEVAPQTNAEKKDFLLRNGIALWDVVKSCAIINADDASIRGAIANDFACIFNKAHIRAVFTTGRKAGYLYERLCKNRYEGTPHFCLPSTSPANAGVKFDGLAEAYRKVLQYI